MVDRIRRAIAEASDAISQRLTPISKALGHAFGAEDWYIDLFAEEVVRGGPAFAVSLVLSAVEPALRAAAQLGSWQMISPGQAVGRVCKVSGLHEVQEEVNGAAVSHCDCSCLTPLQHLNTRFSIPDCGPFNL